MKKVYDLFVYIVLVVSYGNLPHYWNWIPLILLGSWTGHHLSKLEDYGYYKK